MTWSGKQADTLEGTPEAQLFPFFQTCHPDARLRGPCRNLGPRRAGSHLCPGSVRGRQGCWCLFQLGCGQSGEDCGGCGVSRPGRHGGTAAAWLSQSRRGPRTDRDAVTGRGQQSRCVGTRSAAVGRAVSISTAGGRCPPHPPEEVLWDTA